MKRIVARTSSSLLVALVAACGGQHPTYTISGVISGPASAGVAVNLTGDSTATTTTTATGAYVFQGLPPGSYVMTPALAGFLFEPAARSIALSRADASAQGFASGKDPSIVRFTGLVKGAAAGGVNITLTAGGSTRVAVTDSLGRFDFGLVPDGTYTVTASASPWSFVPSATQTVTTNHNDSGAVFVATPASSPGAVHVAGDVASGVQGGIFPSANGEIPNPDVLVYDPPNKVWTFTLRFDAGGFVGLGGAVSFRGPPAAGTYTEVTAGLLNSFISAGCWAVEPATPPGQQIEIEHWNASHFSLALDSVGPPVATNLPSTNGNFKQVFYSVHGSLHADCPAMPNSGAQGTVTLDITF
jgi:hypothetical protein